MIRFVLTAAFLLLGLSNSLKAQSVCIPNDLMVYAIRGKVLTVEKQSPFPEILIRIFNEDEEDENKRLIASTKTDDNGGFEFPLIKRGKYFVVAEPPGFPPYGVRVELKNSKKDFQKEAELHDIIIAFGDDSSKRCRGNYSELHPVNSSQIKKIAN